MVLLVGPAQSGAVDTVVAKGMMMVKHISHYRLVSAADASGGFAFGTASGPMRRLELADEALNTPLSARLPDTIGLLRFVGGDGDGDGEGAEAAAAESLSRISCGTCDAAEQDDDGGGVEEGVGGGDGGLEILGEASVSADPGEEALDHPAAGMNGETDLILRLAHDLDADRGGTGDAVPCVAAIHEGELHEGTAPTRRTHQRRGAVTVLNVGRMVVERQPAAVGVHHRVPLAALDLLARVVAARAAALGGLDALAVDHRRRRAGLATGALAVEHDEVMVDRLEHAAIAQPDEPAVDRAPGRETVGQQAPGAARPQHVEDGVGDLAQRPGTPPPTTRRTRQQRFQDPPFVVGQITRIAQARAAMLPTGGRGPHRVVRPRCRNPVESRCRPAIQPH